MHRLDRKWLVAAVYSVILACSPIAASATTIDFEGWADEALIGSIDGANFTGAIVGTAEMSLNEFEVPPRSGQNVVLNAAPVMRIDFAQHIAQLRGYLTYSQPVELDIFGVGGLLGTYAVKYTSNLGFSGVPNSVPNEEFFFTMAEPITRLDIRSASALSFGLDDLSWSVDPSPVPEPATWLMLLAGLALVAAFRASATRRWGIRAALVVPCCAHAQVVLPDLLVYPQNVAPAKAQVVEVSLRIIDMGVIAGSVILNEIDANQKILRKLTRLVDDGSEGDEVAGDKRYTGRFMVNEPSARALTIAASVALAGQLRRQVSPLSTVWISADAPGSQSIALVREDQVIFKDAVGITVKSLPLAINTKTAVNTPTGPVVETAVDTAFASELQQRVGVLTTLLRNKASHDEGWNAPSLFRYFSADGTLRFSRTSAVERTFLTDPQLQYISRKGDRLILVEVDDENTAPSILYLDENGAVLAQYANPAGLASVSEIRLSSSGRYIGIRGTSGEPGAPQTVLAVVDTTNGAVATRQFDDLNGPSVDLAENVEGSFSVIVANEIGEQLP